MGVVMLFMYAREEDYMDNTSEKKQDPNFQNVILNQVKKDKVPVTIFLTNGFQIRGVIKSFDNYIILVESDGKQQMVYKHAVSTLIPLKPITLETRK